MTYENVISLLGAVLGITGLFFTWRSFKKNELSWKEDQYRREEVLKWAEECIVCLQNLYLTSSLGNALLSKEKIESNRLDAVFLSSSLIERGRLFFKNEVVDDFGAEKRPAYRGYRPQILDPLVIAHQIAIEWPAERIDDERRRSALALDCVNKFVSLAQLEVGREKSASVEARKGGRGINLKVLLDSGKI